MPRSPPPTYRNPLHCSTAVYCFTVLLLFSAWLYRETLDTQRRVLGRLHPDTLRFEEALGHWDEAVAIGREIVGICKDLFGLDSVRTAAAVERLALAYRNAQRLDEAEPTFRELVDLRRQSLPEKPPQIAGALVHLC